MLEFGYIRLFRSLTNWEWYTDVNTKSVFLHLILTANYEPKQWRGITVERGQRIYSRASIASELRMSERSVRTALNHLISTGEVTNQTTPQYSMVTIKNYDQYQQVTNETTNDRPANDQPTTSDRPLCNKAKESNKAIKITYSEYRDAFLKYCISLPQPEDLGKWSSGRKKRIRDKNMTSEEMSEVFERIEASNFLTGRVKEFRASIDWILKPENWKKIIEGNYDNRGPIKKVEAKTTYDIAEYENSGVFSDFDRK